MNVTTVTTSSNSAANASSPSLSGWQNRAVHAITLPSGQRVRIKLPGVATLLERGEIPPHLGAYAVADLVEDTGAGGVVAKALEESGENQSEGLRQRIAEFAAYQRHLVSAAVVAFEENGEWVPVKLTDEQMATLPENDLSLISDLVKRLRGTDARGVRIGVEPIDRWELFRSFHSCGENCEGCQRMVEELSSTDVDDL